MWKLTVSCDELSVRCPCTSPSPASLPSAVRGTQCWKASRGLAPPYFLRYPEGVLRKNKQMAVFLLRLDLGCAEAKLSGIHLPVGLP